MELGRDGVAHQLVLKHKLACTAIPPGSCCCCCCITGLALWQGLDVATDAPKLAAAAALFFVEVVELGTLLDGLAVVHLGLVKHRSNIRSYYGQTVVRQISSVWTPGAQAELVFSRHRRSGAEKAAHGLLCSGTATWRVDLDYTT